MRKISMLLALLFFSELVCACGTNAQREKMAEKLYADNDMQKFVCASDSCSMQQFEEGLQFHKYEKSFRGKKVLICLVEPKLSATNSYAGIFSAKGGEYEFQFISYGTGVKVVANKVGIPMIVEYGVSDPDNPDYSLNQYLWNGRKFIFYRNMKVHD
ncbi:MULTISPECIES: hypothetical protein [Ralstonia]|uniref:hypothetical protein n=1 Tax=Ralstonia TaxID=48736 RepID=UPI0003860434|nr:MULTISPECIES: hypothetical protein [Ralstonia]EPX98867.1 hypothetical protein C404_06670 [Ralstonia sp. AU12-08]